MTSCRAPVRKRVSHGTNSRILGCSVIALAALGTGCEVPMLVHAGYAAPNKVWYHWQQGTERQTIVVCDVQPDGSETNCRESEI